VVHREEQDDEETAQAIKEIVVKWGDKPDET
jgi:hypothetical protein